MTEAERMKFGYGTSDNLPTSQSDEDQTQPPASAMFTLWNLIADLDDSHYLNENQQQQQQILDFYGKAGTTFPRLVCLVQLFLNSMEILERVKDFVVFSEGDNHQSIINENFIRNVEMIIKKDYHKYDRSYLTCMEIDREINDPMVIVSKDAVLLAWQLYESFLKIATKLFTIDYSFSSKAVLVPSVFSSPSAKLKQSIMYFDFNIFPTASITVKHPLTGQTGIIKNKPALGERAIHELMEDNLLKFNYFLLDSRGRSTRSYLKVPPPPINDPTREQFIAKMLRHGINVEEYCSIYERCSIPPNNDLSNLTLDIFANNSNFVNQYSKYRDALKHLIHKHIADSVIRETDTGTYIVENQNTFILQFDEIENLTTGTRIGPTSNRAQSTTTVNYLSPLLPSKERPNAVSSKRTTEHQRNTLPPPLPITGHRNTSPLPPMNEHRNASPPPPMNEHRNASPPPLMTEHQNASPPPPLMTEHRNASSPPMNEHRNASPPPLMTACQNTAPARINVFSGIVGEIVAVQDDSCREASSNQIDADTAQISLSEQVNSFDGIHSLSSSSCEERNNAENENSYGLTQRTPRELTNVYENGFEEAVKKVMKNIMTGKSVVYAKTDFSHICNKPNIRLEAIKRLVESNLLIQGNNFWVEPNRSKKEPRVNAKCILKEGWIKSFPKSNTDVAKFEFMQLLQEKMNLTYEEYLESFYPYQQENVFTVNNWTLSDHFITLMESNFFYQQHVRWNTKRYRPCHSIMNEINVERETETSLSQVPPLQVYETRTVKSRTHDASEQNQHEKNEELTYSSKSSIYRKRRFETEENYDEKRQTRTQTRKLKKN